MRQITNKAIIIGASSGLGKELSEILASEGYHVGMAARREEFLLDIKNRLIPKSYSRRIDVRNTNDTVKGLDELIDTMGGVDLVIICAGVGYLNPGLDLDKELDTVETNVQGFTVAANTAFKHFLQQGKGHLVGISSIAAIRGGADAPAYNASKAFLSNYLEGLEKKAVTLSLPITVTDIQAGFINTNMAKGQGLFWVAPVQKAARQIYSAIVRKKSHAYVTKRWRIIAWVLKCMPRALYNRL